MTEPKEEFAARGSIIVKAIKVEWEKSEAPMLLHVAGADGPAIEEVLALLRTSAGIKDYQCRQLRLHDHRGSPFFTGQAAIWTERAKVDAYLEEIGERGDRVMLQFTEELLAEAGRAD